jgi:hypothetical protein
MYTKLMEKSERSDAMRRGMTLIAAGFAQPDNRDNLINAAYSGGGGKSSAPSMTELLALQKYQTEQADTAARRAQLPALAAKYKLDPATIEYLDRTGQLDETITKLNDPETEVVEAANGSKKLINSNTGETVKELSPAKPRETEWLELERGNKILVYKDDQTTVSTGEKITYVGPKEKPITIEPLADGRKQAVQDGKPIGEPWGPETNVSTDDIKEWQEINKQEAAKGEPLTSLKEWIISRTEAGTERGNQGATGINYGDPPRGQAWKRDETGKVALDEDGAPISVWIKNSPEYASHLKTIADTKATEQKLADDKLAAEEAAKQAGETDVAKATQRVIIDEDIKDAMDLVIKGEESTIPPAGWGGLLSFIPETDFNTLGGKLGTIKTDIGLTALQEMRQASKTGGALGSVTEGEHKMLQRIQGEISQTSKPEVLVHNLMRLQVARSIIVNGIEDPPGSQKFRKPTVPDIEAAIQAIPEDLPAYTPPADDEGETEFEGGVKMLPKVKKKE